MAADTDTDVALTYLGAGWPVLPLPAGRKAPPPDGLTGDAGTDLTPADIEVHGWPAGNIGLRMPPDVIGLDVDAYRGGLDTMRALTAKLGKLPPSYVSHNGRDDGSGIRFYRVPWGARFVANLPGIEVIQRHHRYAVVWPSLHPDGRRYGWWDVQAGEPYEGVPEVAELPELPWAWVGALAVEGEGQAPVRPAAPAEVEAYLAAHVEELAGHYLGVITNYYALKVRDGFSRHDTMTHALIWAMECARAAMLDAGRAINALHVLWLESFTGAGSRRPTSTEWPDMLRHAVAKAQAAPTERIDALFIENVGFRVALPAPSDSSVPPRIGLSHGPRLPERFWQREAHHVVRRCADLVGVSAEALMLGVLAAVALHVPPVVRLPGKRYGQVNPLACVVGPPGAGKGTTLDRALQLVPPPPNVRPIALGTPQGLVRAFYERNADPETAKHQPLVRHARPVIVRTDEVAAYAAATNGRSAHGDGMLAHLKGAVSGEGIGGGYASDDRNLALAPHSYRLTGVLGIAPAKAAPLFDDLGGGLPERLLFAPVLPDIEAEAPELPALVEDDDTTPGEVKGHAELPPLGWRLPALDGRQAFTDSRAVASWLTAALRHPSGDGLDAHRVYLTHQVAALLAVLDGRWTITGTDLMLAADVLDVSVATRRQLLDAIEAEGAKAGQARARAQTAQAVDQAKALAELAERREVLAMTSALVEDVRERPGVGISELRNRVRSTRRRLWDTALAEAVAAGLVEERAEGVGGQAKRALWSRA
jgi:hypothetical protein